MIYSGCWLNLIFFSNLHVEIKALTYEYYCLRIQLSHMGWPWSNRIDALTRRIYKPVPAQREDLGNDTAKSSSCTPSGEALQRTKVAYLFISDTELLNISVKLHGLPYFVIANEGSWKWSCIFH